MDWMVNYIWLTWNLACMLRTYKTYNSIVGFSKYEFNNKLFSGVTLLRVIPGVTWTQPFIYVYILFFYTYYKLCKNRL